MYWRNGNETVRLDFGETVQHPPNAHTGINQNEGNIGFAEGEDQRYKIDAVANKEGEPHTGTDSIFCQGGGDSVGVAVEFGKGNGTVSTFSIGVGDGNRVGKTPGNVSKSGSNVRHRIRYVLDLLPNRHPRVGGGLDVKGYPCFSGFPLSRE
jgi:hypothetical protein